MHITANGGLGPDGDIVAQLNITQDDGAGIDQYALAQFGCDTAKRAQAGRGEVRHGLADPGLAVLL
jgi:hypothetical protein